MGSTPLPGKDEKRRNGKDESGKDCYGAKKPKSIGQHEILKCVPTALQDLFPLITENTYEGIEKNGEDREQRKNAKTQVQKLLAGYLHCAEPAWAEITVGVEPGPGARIHWNPFGCSD